VRRARSNKGLFAAEITPVDVPHGRLTRTISADEHPRPTSTPEQLAALKPLLGASGTISAGNASGINDGACAMLIASERAAEQHGLQPVARVLGMASAGVAPRVMGIGRSARSASCSRACTCRWPTST
jgi:acetyl-CoA acetyltransferase